LENTLPTESAPSRSWVGLALAVVIAAALGYMYASVLRKLAFDWWTDENYSHGLLIPLVIVYAVWLESKYWEKFPSRPQFAWGLAMIVTGALALWAGTAGAELFVQRMSLVWLLAGLVIYWWGWRRLQIVWFAFVLFLLAVPIPALIFNKIAFPLQIFASQCAVSSMQLGGLPVLRQGNVIELLARGATEPTRLEVVEACSGIRSLMTLVTLAAIFAYVTSGRFSQPFKSDTVWGKFRGLFTSYLFWRAVIIVALAVPLAVLTNALRVSGTGFLAHYYGATVALGFFHEFSGWVLYVLGFVLLLGIGWSMDRIYLRMHEPRKATPVPDGSTVTS
jgi:exosortase